MNILCACDSVLWFYWPWNPRISCNRTSCHQRTLYGIYLLNFQLTQRSTQYGPIYPIVFKVIFEQIWHILPSGFNIALCFVHISTFRPSLWFVDCSSGRLCLCGILLLRPTFVSCKHLLATAEHTGNISVICF